ncbi:MAG: hypothetical protein H7144_06195 [Burkholderiales bacterium]|nr:hypothetical protein [Phycisphaerae bacterium]
MTNEFPGTSRTTIEPRLDRDRIEHVFIQREMQRLLSFAGWTIDDVVNNPIAKRDVTQWYCIGRSMKRRIEVLDLEKQWNPLR